MHSTYVAKLSRDELERRRLAAAKDLQETKDWGAQTRIAKKYGTTTASVSRWNTLLQAKGIDALRRTNPPGRESYLTPDQWTQLAKMLKQGATAHGYKTDLWTSPRVHRLIRETFGVTFSQEYVRHALRDRLGFTRQRPRRIARERDEEKRKAWLTTTWPELKKGRSKKE